MRQENDFGNSHSYFLDPVQNNVLGPFSLVLHRPEMRKDYLWQVLA
jgi:hypothetical protein